MNKNTYKTLFTKDFSKESISEAVSGLDEFSAYISERKWILFAKKLFAASLIHYFHDNPDAILLIHGQNAGDFDDEDTDPRAGCFISRVDIPYVKSIAKKALPGLAIFKPGINRDYDKNALEFRGTGNDDKDLEKLPADFHQLILTEFRPFLVAGDLWEKIGDFDLRGFEFSGMTYAKQHLDELLSHFQIDHHALISGIESEYLKNQNTTPTPRKSLAL